MSEIDIVPETLGQIQEEFKRQFQKDPTVKRIYKRMKNGTVDYADANEFSIRLGEILSEALRKFITADTLPEGRMWYNIASRIMEPTLTTNYSLISQVCRYAQEAVNKKSGLSLQAITPALNQNKIDGFIDKLSSDEFENVQWMLGEPVVNYSQSVVDDSIRENAEFHAQSGLSPKLIRKLGANETRTAVRGKSRIRYNIPCKWCESLAGEWDYNNMPDFVYDNIYRRHEYCRCTVEYVADGKAQNIWTKKIYDVGKDDRIKYSQQQPAETAEDRKKRLGN